MNNFYFTFGSDKGFPYQTGYVIVKADDMADAINKFRMRFPDRHKDTVNCSFWYTEKQWSGTGMSSEYKLHEVIE